jgi:hypothetical protein
VGSRVEYQYADGSSETRTQDVQRKGPPPPSKYISKNQDGVVPEGIKVTGKPRASGALRRTFINHLSTAYADEYITKEEFDARHAEADKAETDAELRVLIADLPSLPAPKVEEPKLTWRQMRRDMYRHASNFWRTGAGMFTVYALFVVSYIGAVSTAVLTSTTMLSGVKHPSGLHAGLAVVGIVAGVVWFVATVVGMINYIDNH